MWPLSRCGAVVPLFLYLLHSVSGNYVITWPKSWFAGTPVQFCIAQDPFSSQGDVITVQVLVPKTRVDYPTFPEFSYSRGTANLPQEVVDQLDLEPETEEVILQEQLRPTSGSKLSCVNLLPPDNLASYGEAGVRVNGTLGGVEIDETRRISAQKVRRIIIQTDKERYKPGQKVQFRLLKLETPNMKVSTDDYFRIYVEDPTGSRIEDWWLILNPSGLVHLDLQLFDEAVEGIYTIFAFSKNDVEEKQFLVEEYVLTRFEITFTAPGYVLASDETLELEICAQYTFGEPVRGNLTININNLRYGSNEREVNFEDEIMGCSTVEISLAPLRINNYPAYVYALIGVIAVTEEGTDVVASESFYIDVSRTVLRFETDSSNYPKPELPYFSSVRVTFNDGSPARNETMTVCSKRWVLPSVVQSMRQTTGCFTNPPSPTLDSPMTLCPEVVCQYLGANKHGIPVAACFVAICRNMTTDDSGVLRVTIPPHLFNDPLVEAEVEVTAVNYPDLFIDGGTTERYMQMPIFHLKIGRKRYFSPSNSSLFINPDNLKLECTSGSNIDLQLPVMYAARGAARVTLYVQVVSRSQIQLTKTLSVSLSGSDIEFDDETLVEQMKPPSTGTRRGVFTLPLTLPPTVSPVVRVLIWYTRSDGEVVSDEQRLEVSLCFNHSVEMSWPRDRVGFGEEVPLTLEAEPNALCSVGYVDRSVELLSPQTPLIYEIFSLAHNFDYTNYVAQTDEFEHCVKRSCLDDIRRADRSGEQREQKPELRMINGETTNVKNSFSFYSEFVDAIRIFDDAGLIVISDLTLETRPCKRGSYRSSNNGGLLGGIGGLAIGGLGGSLGGSGLGVTGSAGVGSLLAGLEGLIVNKGGGPYSSGPITPAIEVKTRTYFPETWLWELQTIPASGVYSENRTMPDTITEWVGRAVCVHPDKGIGISAPTSITTFAFFFIDLTLPSSVKVGEIFTVKISVFNYLDTPLPVRITLEESPEYEILEGNTTEAAADQATAGQRSACVPAQDKETVVVRIRFLESGSRNITASAETVPGLVDNCDSGTAPGRDRIITPIAVDYEGFFREAIYPLYYCTDSATNYNGWTLAVPPETNIVNNSARAWITASGELLGPNIENLDWLIRMPYGCGEQNLASFAPGIHVLKYLIRTEQIYPAFFKLYEYMLRGYQQQLNYERTDGSYSVWGNSDQYGSTWLTAFVLKTYAQAEEFIGISSSRIERPLSWLMSLQLPSGCFQLVGHVHNRRMKGGLGEGAAPGALTAYVMAALLEAGVPPDSPVVLQATTCIEDATAPGALGENDVYLLALKAYAFSLAGLNQTIAVIDDLFTRAEQNSDGIYWKMESHSGWYSDALSVETTSYVLLAILTSDYPDPQSRKLRVLKWILSRRNGQGGFVSTQDTVVGLQALALFGSPVPDEPFDAAVSFTGSNIMETLQVTEDNKILLQRFDVELLPAQIDVEFSGEGCIFVEGVVRYNVPDPDLSEVFSVSVSTNIDYNAAVCQTNVIEVCATYSAANVESNMGIIEVNLVSGYLPDTQSLDRIVSDVTGVIKRYDLDGSQVIFYIDKFTDSQICVQFVAYEEAEVEMTSPGTVRVYDYYEPEFYVNEVFQFTRRYCP